MHYRALELEVGVPHAPWQLDLITLSTPDGGALDVAVSPSGVGSAEVAVIHLHGKGGNFYGVPARLLAPTLAAPDVVNVAVNMRCHDLGYTRTDAASPDFTEGLVPVGGGWWEDLEAGISDITAAIDYTRSLGCRRTFLVGHSSGGFYATRYAGEVGGLAGLALLSPLTSNKTALPVWFPDEADLRTAYASAQDLVNSGRGHEILPLSRWYYGISASSFLQRAAEPDGVWRTYLEATDCPVLMIGGGAESRAEHWAEEMARLPMHHGSRTVVIPGADHHYIGFEDRVQNAVAAFVAEHVPGLSWPQGEPF